MSRDEALKEARRRWGRLGRVFVDEFPSGYCEVGFWLFYVTQRKREYTRRMVKGRGNNLAEALAAAASRASQGEGTR